MVSTYEINGQGNLLARWLDSHTSHKVTNAISDQTYLNYPYDKKVAYSTNAIADEIRTGGYDFVILRWIDPKIVYDLFKRRVIRRNNSILRLHGSEVRYYPFIYRGLWTDPQSRITMVSNGYDYHLNKDLGFVLQHIPPMIDCKRLWDIQNKAQLYNSPITIGHAPTDPNKKGTKYFLNAMAEIKKKVPDLQEKIITGTAWESTIKEKSSCHIIFDQISQDIGIGTFGVNLLEALAQSKPVMADLNHFTYSMYPEMLKFVTHVRISNLEEQIIYLYEKVKAMRQSGHIYELNAEGREFVAKRFDINTVALQWKFLIEHIYESESI